MVHSEMYHVLSDIINDSVFQQIRDRTVLLEVMQSTRMIRHS